jgi:HAD superfamily hydrolase (TIGR01509 family)
MLKGVLLDFDGTLTVPILDFKKIKSAMGIEKGLILEHLESVSPAERERLERILEDFEREAAEKAALRPGARELIAYLRSKRIPFAVVTNNTEENVRTVLRRFDMEVDCIVSREVGHWKPSPEPLRIAARRLELEPEELALVGDHRIDILSGRQAGLVTILLSRDPIPECDYRVEELGDLPSLIDRILAPLQGES